MEGGEGRRAAWGGGGGGVRVRMKTERRGRKGGNSKKE